MNKSVSIVLAGVVGVMAFEMNLAAEAYVHNIEIAVHQLQLFLERGLLVNLFYVVAEEIRHILHKQAGPVRSLHHGQLRARVQGIEQEMRINLGLKIFQLGVL